MARELQIRCGTTQANDLFIGAEGELTMDTTTKGLRIHDGQTVGGFKIDTVVDFQVPTSSNNYTWYRKYSSGWVEQGGRAAQGTVNLPITMLDNQYTVVTDCIGSGANPGTHIDSITTTSFVMGNGSGWGMSWEVKGVAA